MAETSAKVVADSMSPDGVRLTTLELVYPRFIHSEFMTHRVMSRNAASSRAIPVERLLSNIEEDPAYPVVWPCEQPGMQGGAELIGDDAMYARQMWDEVRLETIHRVRQYLHHHEDKSTRLHKSVVNRLLEPFAWMTTVVSSTEWANFFGLRCSPLAQPEFRALAEMIRDAIGQNTPKALRPLEWHLPYVDRTETDDLGLANAVKVSVARCARVSSLHAGEHGEYEKDYRLFNTLTTSKPMHASPLEHVARPCLCNSPHTTPVFQRRTHAGNFEGWDQLRHLWDATANWLRA